MFEPTESLESENATPGGAELRPPEPLFSELIDRWLLEGERLDEQARPAADAAPSPPETWRTRAVELGGRILAKHRLEVLVGIGLVPLMLFLVTQGSGHRDAPSAARPTPPPAGLAVATVPPQRPAPVALVSVPENPRVRAVPKPAEQHHRPLAHRATHAAPSPKLAPQKTALQKTAAQKTTPQKTALHNQPQPQPAPSHKPAPQQPAPSHKPAPQQPAPPHKPATPARVQAPKR